MTELPPDPPRVPPPPPREDVDEISNDQALIADEWASEPEKTPDAPQD